MMESSQADGYNSATHRAHARKESTRRRVLTRKRATVPPHRAITPTEERQAELDARAAAPADWKAQFDSDAPTAEQVESDTWMSAEEEDWQLSLIQDELMMMGRANGTRMVAREFFKRHGYALDQSKLGDRIMNGHFLREQDKDRLSPRARIERMLLIEDEAVARVMEELRYQAGKHSGTNVANLVVALAKLHDVSAKRIPGAIVPTRAEVKMEHSGGTDNTMNIMLGGMMDIVEERAAEQLPEALRAELTQGQPALTAGPLVEPDEILDAIRVQRERR